MTLFAVYVGLIASMECAVFMVKTKQRKNRKIKYIRNTLTISGGKIPVHGMSEERNDRLGYDNSKKLSQY